MSATDASNANLNQQWYVLRGREVLGPYAGHVIQDMVRDRRVGTDAMVALPGSAEWQSISVLTGAGAGAPHVPPTSVSTAYRRYAGF